MSKKLSSTAIETLRSTLETIEQQSGLVPDDVALLELKRIVVARIAELEAAEQSSLSDVRPEAPPILETGASSSDPAITLALDLAVSLVSQNPPEQSPQQRTAKSRRSLSGGRGGAEEKAQDQGSRRTGSQ
jgi:hypothetical protein